jgi:hypothetical protein
MTAYPDDAALRQLEQFGTVECFVKPLDVPVLTKRMVTALSDGLRGTLRNISLPSLLQLVDMEKKTCTFVLAHAAQSGRLYFRDGDLIDAVCGELRGNEAATEMVSWPGPQVTIISTCATKERTVDRPLGFIIMEAMRLLDERVRSSPPALPLYDSIPPPSAAVLEVRSRSLSQFPTPASHRARAMAVIERAGGRVLTCSGRFDGLPALAELLSAVFAAESELASRLGEPDKLEEMVMTSASFWAVCRPLEHPGNTLAVSVFDPTEATVAMERLELNGLAAALRAWSRHEAV